MPRMTLNVYRIDPATSARTEVRYVDVPLGAAPPHPAISAAFPPCRCARCPRRQEPRPGSARHGMVHH
ncbi:hypothetical protein GCM10017688_46190 [Streptomyces ramulosus]